ncbi:MAG TPA: alpha/beta hydrolase [Terriglobales bacterium]|nr:alpha/beta hydrolase [Terriglobales bacterium]
MTRDITSVPPAPANDRICYGDGASQFFDLFFGPNETRGAAMMIHGGFWRARYDLQHASHLCAALAREGIAVANLEYRRVGEPGGGWPRTYEDVLSGFDAVRKKLGDRVLVLGHSAGGYLALRLTADRHPAGVVALAPVADLSKAYELNLSNGAVVEFLGGTPEAIPSIYEAADPRHHASSVQRCLIHGEQDDTVPMPLSYSYLQARGADKPDIVLVKIKDANHFDLIDPESPSGWDPVRRTVNALLGLNS